MLQKEHVENLTFEDIIKHRRDVYFINEIRNKVALKETGSVVLLLTASVDVHKEWLGVEIKGWCGSLQSYSIDW